MTALMRNDESVSSLSFRSFVPEYLLIQQNSGLFSVTELRSTEDIIRQLAEVDFLRNFIGK